jgi:hypothetical protein
MGVGVVRVVHNRSLPTPLCVLFVLDAAPSPLLFCCVSSSWLRYSPPPPPHLLLHPTPLFFAGWEEGKGLGAAEQGRVVPIAASGSNSVGLGVGAAAVGGLRVGRWGGVVVLP